MNALNFQFNGKTREKEKKTIYWLNYFMSTKIEIGIN